MLPSLQFVLQIGGILVQTPTPDRDIQTILKWLSCGWPAYKLKPADVLFVFGNNRISVAQQAESLWKMGLAPCILVTGKVRFPLPAPFTTEADYYAHYLEHQQIPAEAIVREREATNTLENVQFGLAALAAADRPCRSLIAVSRPPLMRRCLATLAQQAPEVQAAGLQYLETDWQQPEGTTVERLVAELDRLEQYAAKGDIAPVVIPPRVRAAGRRLLKQR